MDQQERQQYTKLLFSISVVATNHGLCKKAEEIIQPLILLNPEKEEPVIGAAYNLISWGKPAKAVELFREKTKIFKQPSAMYDAMTGLALFFDKQLGEAERLLLSVKNRGAEDPAAVQLAETLLLGMQSPQSKAA